jgi:hypothetical protein
MDFKLFKKLEMVEKLLWKGKLINKNYKIIKNMGFIIMERKNKKMILVWYLIIIKMMI